MHRAPRHRVALALALSALGPVSQAATDKSGVSPQSISLPSGPGSIEGLGESFEPQLNSGTFSYRIPLKLPPIRGGAPPLALAYSSGNGNGMLGQGWTLRIPCVRRQTDKGLPQYANSDLFYDENAEELVHLADGAYRQKIESLFIQYERTAGGGWTGRMPNGTLLSLGATNQSRLDWATNGTFSWMIDSSQDPNGNRVEYHYLQDGQQIYPQEIRYGLHATQPSSFFSVQFGYSTNRPDQFVDCRSRFASTNRLCLHSITVFFGPRRLRQWQFSYDTNAPVSLLTSVTMFGDDRSATNNTAQANVDYLPPTRFAYTPYTIATQAQVMTISFSPSEPNFAFGGEDGGSSGNYAEFVDINHDGHPDILVNSGDEWRSLLNPGPFTNSWPLSQLITNPPPITGVSLGQSSTRLVDLRGDGRSKLMVAQSDLNPDQATAFYYYDFLSPTTLGPAQPYATINGIALGQNEVQFLDLDDDKAMDILRINGSGPSGFLEGVYTRMFQAPTNQYLTTPNNNGFDFTQGWKLADMNGDRLQDFVWLIGTDNTEVSLNTGWGQFAPPYLMTGGPDMSTLQAPGTSGPQLVDLNQDGLADLVIVENGDVRIWFNQNGVGWSDPVLITGTPAYQSGQTIVRFADINGNGSTDIIWHAGQDPFINYVDLFPTGKAYLLNHSTTTLGRSLDISYRSSTDFMTLASGTSNQWTVVAPFPVPVISQMVEGDGLGNLYTNQFSYRNGYYDGLEREFRGFEQATRTEVGSDSQGAPTLVTRFQFDTGATNESLKGKPLRLEAVSSDGAVFYRQTNQWFPRLLSLPIATGETRSVTFAFQNHKLTQEVELGPETNAVTLEEEFNYDDFGNQIFHADYGRVENGNRAAWGDERQFVRQFSAEFPSGTNLWLLDRLVKEERQDLNGLVIARKQVYYDDATLAGNNLGLVTIGNPTLVQEWIDISNNVSRPTLRQAFDLYGNVTDTYDPLGTPGRPDLGHTRHIDFDSQIHTHPVHEIIYTANPDAIAAGSPQPALLMQADYDFGLGVLRSAIDFNQNTTLFGFDTFDRLVTITKPYDTTNLPTALFSYFLQQPIGGGQTINFTASSLREVAGQIGTYDSRSFFDGLGQKVMSRSESDTNGVVIVNDATLFNQRRSAWRSFLPYFEAGTLNFSSINQTGPYVETHHDALGRQTETSQPPTSADNHRALSRTLYGPLTRFLQDEEQARPSSPHFGAGMRYTEDGLRDNDRKGRLRLVEEIVKLTDDGLPTADTDNWQTQYRYDLLDNFLGYTDSQNNQKEFHYDALSRKTFMNDPDRGTMQWNYDLASNVTNTSDAKGQQIAYSYDGANRLRTEQYLDGQPLPPWRTGSPLPGGEGAGVRASVIYHYDLPFTNLDLGDTTTATASNTLGKLAWVEDLSGEEHTSYDSRGRVSYVVKRIPDPQFLSSISNLLSPLVSYRTAFSYDSLDRVTALTYPDNDAISYIYNNRNLLSSILGGVNGLTRAGAIIENISYRASAQLDSITYGNGVITRYDYDPRLRLTTLATLSHPMGEGQGEGLQLINFAYDFDDASNIKAIHDNRPTSVVAAGDPRRNTQLYDYDDLYRITYAGYCFGPPGATNVDGGSINYRYDRIGNMLAQSSTINDTDPLTGLLVANLGTMSSGGAAGRSNRTGRSPTDPPGPHALSSIQNPVSSIQNRAYPYDPNGNMLNVDGLTNTWDFKDRLIAVENSQMRAQYTYDYTDRRIIKNVAYKPDSVFVITNHASLITTLYIDKFFEVREHDAPTKYVWNGNTRVARVTGSLNSDQRVQRVRLWPGYNLISVGVNGAALPGKPGLTAYLWNLAIGNWQLAIDNQTINAGTVLWVQAATNAVLAFAGTYSDPINSPVPTGPSFLPVPGLETLNLSTTNSPLSTNQWHYHAQDQLWRNALAVPLTNINSLPSTLAPGEVLFVRVDATTQLTPTDPALRVRYYHEDHLGSSSVLSDSFGQLVSEIANYIFGFTRNEFVPRNIHENYQFTQKERDSETALSYCETRFENSAIARFTSVDTVVDNPQLASTFSPRRLNSYGFCGNNPIGYQDPTGRDFSAGGGGSSPIPDPKQDAITPDLVSPADLVAAAVGWVLGSAVAGGGVAAVEAESTVAGGGAASIRASSPKAPTSESTTPADSGVAPPKPQHPDSPNEIYHRLESPTQSSEVAKMQENGGELWGRAPRGSDNPTAQAYRGSLPEGAKGVEFRTPVKPDPGSPPNSLRWSGPREGVTVENDFAKIPIEVLKNTQ